jgi:UDP-N-acetylglucosamine acyltransferase
MANQISPLSEIHPDARIGDGVRIGPFCVVGPHVEIGAGCVLESHVALVGHTRVGTGNRFWPNSVIGGEPQDKSYVDGATRTEIGNDNQFREGVTVHRGAEKEDGVTRIGNRNLLMANSHVAHNCHIHDDVILVNGVLLGGHVHIQDRAVISGNSVIHHFATVGRVAFVGGGSRVTIDVPPYMMVVGSDQATVRNINFVGLQRAGLTPESIAIIKQAYRLLYRQSKSLAEVRVAFREQLGDVLPADLMVLLDFLERQSNGRVGRQREAFRGPAPAAEAA